MPFDQNIATAESSINEEPSLLEFEPISEPTEIEQEPFYKPNTCPPMEYNFPIILSDKVGKAVVGPITKWTSEYGPMPKDDLLNSLPRHQRAEIYMQAVQSYLGAGPWKRLAEITVKAADSNHSNHGQVDLNYRRAKNYQTLTQPTFEYNCMASSLGMCPFYPKREPRKLFEEMSQYYGFGVTHKLVPITYNWSPANIRKTEAYEKYLEAVNVLSKDSQEQDQKELEAQLKNLSLQRPPYIPFK